MSGRHTTENAHMCRVCHTASATNTTTFEVAHNGARVEHHTCDRHTSGLLAAMQDAGWAVVVADSRFGCAS